MNGCLYIERLGKIVNSWKPLSWLSFYSTETQKKNERKNNIFYFCFIFQMELPHKYTHLTIK